MAALGARRVLVVDDSEELLEVYGEIPREEGYSLATADSGEKAVEIADSFRPELVITDLNMPGMSGLDLMKHFNTEYRFQRPILMTVSGFDLAREEAQQYGVRCFLKKPVGFEELLSEVRSALDGEPATGKERYEQERLKQRSSARGLAARAGQSLLKDPLVAHQMERLVCVVSTYFGADAFLVCPRDSALFIDFTSAPKRFPRNSRAEGLFALAADVIESGQSLVLPDVLAASLRSGLPVSHPPHVASLAMTRCLLEDIPVGTLCLSCDRPLSLEGNDLSILELLGRSLRAESDVHALHKPTLHSTGMFSKGTLRSVLQLELATAVKKGESLSLVAVETIQRGAEARERVAAQLRLPRTLLAQLRTNWVGIAHRGAAEAVRRAGLASLRVFADHQALRAAGRLVLDAPSSAHSALDLMAWLKEILASALDGPSGTILSFEGKLEITHLE